VGTKPAEAAFAGKYGRIAFMSSRDGDFEVFVMGVNGSNQTSRTNNEVLDEAPVFSPEGKGIAFHSQRVENLEVFAINANGSGIKNLTRRPARDGIVDWQAITAPTDPHRPRNCEGPADQPHQGQRNTQPGRQGGLQDEVLL
jgi:hypothetical protein